MKRISYTKVTPKQVDDMLLEHIIRGDRGDGIPNILSPDNTFVAGERQKVINSKKIKAWLDDRDLLLEDDTAKRGWYRNKMLIDLNSVPDDLEKQILETFDNTKIATKQTMLNFLIKNRLASLVEVADEF
jgi:hypothetical protein